MKSSAQPLIDKISISASLICAIHCAVLPILLAVSPALSFLPNNDHAFHEALVYLIVPLGLSAAFLGCRKHKDNKVLFGILSGLAILLFATFLGHDFVGEAGEKLLTVAATIILALSHWRNYKLCRKDDCEHECS